MTSPPTPPYTEATVELVALALFEADRLPLTDPPWEKVAEFDRDSYRRVARLQLDALVKAGLLLPEGAETRTEYGVQHSYPGEEPITIPATNHVMAAQAVVRSPRRLALMERTSWHAPWRSADATRLAEGGGVADQSKDHPTQDQESA